MSGMNSTADQEEDLDDDDEEEEQTNVPAALARWRRAVAETEIRGSVIVVRHATQQGHCVGKIYHESGKFYLIICNKNLIM